MGKIVSLWADDTKVMGALRDLPADILRGEDKTQRLVHLLKLLGSGTGLPFDQLSDADIKNSFSWIASQS